MLQAIILGIVQGLTEFLPVSSTAHLILFPWFFNWSGEVDTLGFDVALHGGTLLAILFSFRKDWFNLFFRNHRLLGLIIAASVPAGFTGFFLNHFVEHSLRSPLLISITLIVGGVIMLAAEKIYKYRDMDRLVIKDVIFIGVAQAIAIIPGVSRSGMTIAAGLFRGLEREAAAKFSFLLSTPIIAGALMLHFRDAFINNGGYNLQIFAAGLISSFITGFLAIKFMMKFLKRYPLNLFVYYRFLLAAVIIAGIWLKG
jgi:undecaprenyl-diphosphatase